MAEATTPSTENLNSVVEPGIEDDMGEGEAGKVEMTPSEGQTLPTKSSQKFRPKNGCQKCCGSIMNLFANDAIYGSFVGPHPVSFFCIFKPCKKCISRSCAQPLCVASIATKVMNIIMLGIVTLLACFFIAPWWVSPVSTPLIDFYPCQGKMVWKTYENGGCPAHAGYYMAYRCFFAFAIVMLTNCFAMLDVTSTSDDPYRKRIHHGFWLYKYIYLFAWILVFFLFLKGSADKDGYFEYTASIIGNGAHVIFSFLELTMLLDIVEIWAVSVSITNNSWSNFMYRLIAGLIFIIDIIFFLHIVIYFAFKLDFPSLDLKWKAQFYDILEKKAASDTDQTIKDLTGSGSPKDKESFYKFIFEVVGKTVGGRYNQTWPHTNCLPGSYKPGGFFNYELEGEHFGLICGTLILSFVLVVVMFLKQQYSKRYPFQGWLQVAVIILFNLFYLWSALYNSPNIHSRPRCNWALRNSYTGQDEHKVDASQVLVDGSHDTYFRYPGFFHGLSALFTLFYFAFVHGPRSKTAPLSLGYRHFFAGGYDRVPVYPDLGASPPELKRAVENLEVWDDEQDKVAQSWSTFYLMMVFGSLSLMMAMTNFTDPWAPERYNTSRPAMAFKYCTAFGITLAYIFMLICPCTRVYRAYQSPIRKRRVIRKSDPGTGEEAKEEIVIELVEDEDEVSIEEATESTHQPKQCGCMM